MGPDASLTPELIASQSFTSNFRGYDPTEVRTFLNRLAAEMRAWRERAEHLESAWHSAEERAARPPVLDEDTLMAAVGEETASILRSARAAAADMRTKASEEAEKILADARSEATRLEAEARATLEQGRVTAEETSSRLLAEAREQAAEIVEKARIEAEGVRAQAEKERLLTIEGATATRDRILEDLARRRRIATVQIEQLRAGRERLIESYAVVRRTLEEASAELSRADAEARAAADEVGRRMRDQPESFPEDPVASVPTAETPASEEANPAATGVPEPAPAVEASPSPAAETPAPIPARVETPAPAAAEAAREAPAPAPAPVDGRPSSQSEADPAGDDEQTSAVDELFARIRGAQPEAPADVQVETDPPVSDGDESLLQAREKVTSDLEVTLARRMKRALQDEQNDVLDRLRGMKGAPTADRLLPALGDQRARYIATARALLAQAAAGGAEFAWDVLSEGTSRSGLDLGVDVDDLAAQAADSIVEPLRRRLEEAVAGAGEEQSVLVDSLGAAYREWKGQRMERLAGDLVTSAFSRGTWEATSAGHKLRWLVDDLDGACPDCDDDALAGELPKGESFPTGQPYPPAHAGCRCLLAPVPAEPAPAAG